jgi:hypothetical protein
MGKKRVLTKSEASIEKESLELGKYSAKELVSLCVMFQTVV